MSTKTDPRTSRLPLSLVNIILISVLLIGAVLTAIFANWTGTAFLGVMGVLMIIFTRFARRPTAGDLERINALEYADERDRDLARRGFSVVGATALLLAVVETTAAIVAAQPLLITLASAQLIVLAIVWAVANARVVRAR